MVTLIFISRDYKIVQNEKTQISTNPGTNASVGSGYPLVVKTSADNRGIAPVRSQFWIKLVSSANCSVNLGQAKQRVTYPSIRWSLFRDLLCCNEHWGLAFEFHNSKWNKQMDGEIQWMRVSASRSNKLQQILKICCNITIHLPHINFVRSVVVCVTLLSLITNSRMPAVQK